MKRIICILFVFTTQLNHAQCYCCGSTSGFSGGESGLGDVALQKNSLALETTLDLRSFNGIKSQSRSQEFGVSTTTALPINSMAIGIVGLRYGINNRTALLLQQPLFLINSPSLSTKTFGDLLALVNYRLLTRERFLLDGQSGLEFPSGQFVALSNGSSVSTGSGSWDPVAGLSAKFPGDKGSFRLAGFFKYSTKGYHETYYGNFFGHQLDYTRLLSRSAASCSADSVRAGRERPVLSLRVQVSGEWSQMQRNNNAYLENTGSYVALAGLGFTFSYKGFAVPVTLSTPLIQQFHGEQNSTAFRFRIGISKVFN